MSQAVSSPTPRLVQTYNRNLTALLKGAIEVAETQKSFSDRIAGASQTVTLENKNRGAYAVLTEGNINYLVPSAAWRK